MNLPSSPSPSNCIPASSHQAGRQVSAPSTSSPSLVQLLPLIMSRPSNPQMQGNNNGTMEEYRPAGSPQGRSGDRSLRTILTDMLDLIEDDDDDFLGGAQLPQQAHMPLAGHLRQ